MAFEVVVYYRPRASEALTRTLFASDRDAAAAAVATAATIPLPQQVTVPFRRPWAARQSWSNPPADTSLSITTTEVQPSWRAPQMRPWGVQTTFGVNPDKSEPVVEQPDLGTQAARPIYRTWFKSPRLIGTPAFDDSVEPNVTGDAVGSIVRNIYRKDYAAWIRMGIEPMDLTVDLDANIRRIGKQPYWNRYNVKQALEYLFSIPNDDSTTVASQPDSQGTIVQRTYTTRFNARPALAYAFSEPQDTSFAVGAQAEAVGSVPRRVQHKTYDAKRAAMDFAGLMPGDDSTAPTTGAGGVYIPVFRRRRR